MGPAEAVDEPVDAAGLGGAAAAQADNRTTRLVAATRESDRAFIMTLQT
ncbi:MAG TPA: hypothetical protein VFK35_09175 [Candidatus Limnocylindrales bacterium]|nr:hypothetical protein [Candidatus Limnocylindrales bacterium]